MRNSIEIDFASIDILDTPVFFSYYPNPLTSSAVTVVTEVAKVARTGVGTFTIGATPAATATNYADAVGLDFPTLFRSVVGSKVTISTTDLSPIFDHPTTAAKIGYRVKTGTSYITRFNFLSNPEEGFTTPYTISIPKLGNFNLFARFKLVPTQPFDVLLGVDTIATVADMEHMILNYYPRTTPPIGAPALLPYMTLFNLAPVFDIEINYTQKHQVGFIFQSIPVDGTTIHFQYFKNNVMFADITKTFSTTLNDATHVLIASSILLCAFNLLNNLKTFNILPETEYVISTGDTVYARFTGNVKDLWRQTVVSNTTGSAVVAVTPLDYTEPDVISTVVIPNDIIINSVGLTKVRGSELVVSTDASFDKTIFEIFQWQGSIFDVPDNPYIVVNKTKVRTDQTKIFINISPYFKTGLKADVANFIFNTTNNTFLTSEGETKWGKVIVRNYISGVPDILQSTHEQYFYAVDGYKDMLDIYQNQDEDILLTGPFRYVERNSIHSIFFKTRRFTVASYITSTNSTPVVLDSNQGTPGRNGYYIKGIQVDTFNDAEWIKYTIEYEFKLYEITYFLYDACNSDGWQLIFKNRYGMLEGFPVTQRTNKSITTTGTSYLRNIVDVNGDYDISQHTKKQYNVTGQDTFVFNTDWLPEYMNAPLKELQMTEELYLLDKDMNVYPVIKVDDTVAFKTQKHDKLIQYTISVKLSHETIFNIQ